MDSERSVKFEAEVRAFMREAREFIKDAKDLNKQHLKTYVKVERMEARAGVIAAIFGLAAGFISSVFHKGG